MDSERTDSSPQAPEQHGPEQPRRTRERAFAPLSRRSFLGVAAACGLAAGAGLAGCAPKPDDDPTAQENEQEQPDKNMAPTDIKETLDADVLVVGLGMSGLAAAVQAASNGAKVIGIEKMNATGATASASKASSPWAPAGSGAGIEIDPAEIVRGELEASQWASGGDLWLDLVHSSGGNVDWLMEQGVKFSRRRGRLPWQLRLPRLPLVRRRRGLFRLHTPDDRQGQGAGRGHAAGNAGRGAHPGRQGAVTGAYAESKERGTCRSTRRASSWPPGAGGRARTTSPSAASCTTTSATAAWTATKATASPWPRPQGRGTSCRTRRSTARTPSASSSSRAPSSGTQAAAGRACS